MRRCNHRCILAWIWFLTAWIGPYRFCYRKKWVGAGDICKVSWVFGLLSDLFFIFVFFLRKVDDNTLAAGVHSFYLHGLWTGTFQIFVCTDCFYMSSYAACILTIFNWRQRKSERKIIYVGTRDTMHVQKEMHSPLLKKLECSRMEKKNHRNQRKLDIAIAVEVIWGWPLWETWKSLCKVTMMAPNSSSSENVVSESVGWPSVSVHVDHIEVTSIRGNHQKPLLTPVHLGEKA